MDCNNLALNTGIKCLEDEAKAIMNLIPNMGIEFIKAVNLIFACKGKTIVTGVGKSGHVGAKIAATMASTGTPAFFVNPLDAYHGDLGMFGPDDVVIAISYSGNTDELLRIFPSLEERHIPIIGICGNPKSQLAARSCCFLNIAVEKEACPLNLAPTSSTTATLAMGDALACSLIKLRDFKATDFAKYHPGGSLGKHLLAHVRDFMVKDNLPVVSPDAKIGESLVSISKGKHGLAIVIENNQMIGVVTDGDIRRAMIEKQDAVFSLPIYSIMSRNPKTILESEKLSYAASIMQKYNIHSLIVTDSSEKVVGILESVSCF